eukprot:1188388-Prorocentrum_minimum.AAC.1
MTEDADERAEPVSRSGRARAAGLDTDTVETVESTVKTLSSHLVTLEGHNNVGRARRRGAEIRSRHAPKRTAGAPFRCGVRKHRPKATGRERHAIGSS